MLFTVLCYLFALGCLPTSPNAAAPLPPVPPGINATVQGNLAVSGWISAGKGASVSVAQFGAVGDGVTDDTAAIQAALNTGQAVFGVATGRYLVCGLSLSGNQQLFDLRGAWLVANPACTTYVIKMWSTITGVGGSYSNQIQLQNFYLDMNNVHNIKGIYHSGGWNCRISDIQAVNVTGDSVDLYIDGGTAGTFLSSYQRLQIQSLVVAGNAAPKSVTTASFDHISVTGYNRTGSDCVTLNTVLAIDFIAPTIQNCNNMFALTAANGVHIVGLHSEACTNMFSVSGTCQNIYSTRGEMSLSGIPFAGNVFPTGRWIIDDSFGYYSGGSFSSAFKVLGTGVSESYMVPNATGGGNGFTWYTGGLTGYSAPGNLNTNGVGSMSFDVYQTAPLISEFTIGANNGNAFRTNLWFRNGQLAIGPNSAAPTADLDVKGSQLRLQGAATPANSGATCNAGTFQWDSNFLYLCVAANTYKRIALVAF